MIFTIPGAIVLALVAIGVYIWRQAIAAQRQDSQRSAQKQAELRKLRELLDRYFRAWLEADLFSLDRWTKGIELACELKRVSSSVAALFEDSRKISCGDIETAVRDEIDQELANLATKITPGRVQKLARLHAYLVQQERDCNGGLHLHAGDLPWPPRWNQLVAENVAQPSSDEFDPSGHEESSIGEITARRAATVRHGG